MSPIGKAITYIFITSGCKRKHFSNFAETLQKYANGMCDLAGKMAEKIGWSGWTTKEKEERTKKKKILRKKEGETLMLLHPLERCNRLELEDGHVQNQ